MGTRDGGKTAAATNKKKYGKDFYSRIGKLGGFWYAKYVLGDDNLARESGRKGGRASKRTKRSQ